MSNKYVKVYREPYPTKKFINFVESENINDNFLLAVELWFKRAANNIPDAPEEFYVYHKIIRRIIDEKVFENYGYAPNYLMIMRSNISMEDYCALLEAMVDSDNANTLIIYALLAIDLNIENIIGDYIQYFDMYNLGTLWNKREDSREVVLPYVIANGMFDKFMEVIYDNWSINDVYAAVPNLPPELKLGIVI